MILYLSTLPSLQLQIISGSSTFRKICTGWIYKTNVYSRSFCPSKYKLGKIWEEIASAFESHQYLSFAYCCLDWTLLSSFLCNVYLLIMILHTDPWAQLNSKASSCLLARLIIAEISMISCENTAFDRDSFFREHLLCVGPLSSSVSCDGHF